MWSEIFFCFSSVFSETKQGMRQNMYTVFWYNSEESNEYEKEKLTKEISKGEKCHAITGASEQQKKLKK